MVVPLSSVPGHHRVGAAANDRRKVTALAAASAVTVASRLAAAPAERARLLAVPDELAGLFPLGGLRRGGTVSVRDSTALLFALLARPTAEGSWAAIVGLPNLGVLAAAELGVQVRRLALVPRPGAALLDVVAALVDGMDLVVVGSPVTAAQARRLSARARNRGSVLLAFGPWPGAELELRCARAGWHGLGAGHGYLRHRKAEIVATGRGAAARPVRATVSLPGPGGPIAPAGEPAGELPVEVPAGREAAG